MIPALELAGLPVEENLSMPGSLGEITVSVQELVLKIEEWRIQREIEEIVLFYNKKQSGASYQPHSFQLMPLDFQWLQKLQTKEWPTRVLPQFTMNFENLFAALIRQYFFVSFYQAFTESLASENASRLAAMQAAEKNIEQRLNQLNAQYNQQRQNSITAELLDIISGFEALESES
ncbi:MAG: F0F1 ATP synthase subunit gamma [bacterium]|nr:F0F1 ATP synthase subunit gamma [bacterium]